MTEHIDEPVTPAAELATCERCGWTGPWDEVELVNAEPHFNGRLQRCPNCNAVESF